MAITVQDNTEAVKEAIGQAMYKALYKAGEVAEGDVKKACVVDTGLLRNSITFAVSGDAPSITEYKSNGSHASTPVTEANGTAGKPVNPVKTGSYSGTVGNTDEKVVYIGTNVEYAPYVEYGTSGTTAKPFLKPTIEKNMDKYKRIIEDTLAKEIE